MKYKVNDIIEYEHGSTTEWRVRTVRPALNWKGQDLGNEMVFASNILKDGSLGKKTMFFMRFDEITTRRISVRRSYGVRR